MLSKHLYIVVCLQLVKYVYIEASPTISNLKWTKI